MGAVVTKLKPVDWKAVHSAVRWNKLEELQEFLTNPAATNIPDPGNGNLPIHIAAQNGHFEILKLLVGKGARINAKNNNGNTPLHMAIGYDYYACAKFLIDKGSEKNETNNTGFAAIRGLEGNKTLGVAALMFVESSKNPADAALALKMCEEDIANIDKAAFCSAGLKAKKILGDRWTEDLQTQFKTIMANL